MLLQPWWFGEGQLHKQPTRCNNNNLLIISISATCLQASSSVHYTTSYKHSPVLLRMDEIIARNMLSWLKLLTNCYCCIYLVVYANVSEMHGRLLTYLLTHSMVQSPSWDANWFAASQEIPRISRNPKVHYRTHKRPPTVSTLGQLNPVHITTSHLLEIRRNIIHPSTPRSPQWSPSLRFPQQETETAS